MWEGCGAGREYTKDRFVFWGKWWEKLTREPNGTILSPSNFSDFCLCEKLPG